MWYSVCPRIDLNNILYYNDIQLYLKYVCKTRELKLEIYKKISNRNMRGEIDEVIDKINENNSKNVWR